MSAAVECDAVHPSAWSKGTRRFASAILLVYLFVLMLGPLSNPQASDFLTRPLAERVSTIHRILFLGHGYRFFGPDPGPSHLVVYRATGQDGEVVEGKFPDRETIWPRLLYHRWFMLSETVYQEHAMTPDAESFRRSQSDIEAQIQALRVSGQPDIAQKIAREKLQQAERYAESKVRIEKLVSAIASHLVSVHSAHHIELFVQERTIPFPIQVLTGKQLEDPDFLSPLQKIGEFEVDDAGNLRSLEDVPVAEGS